MLHYIPGTIQYSLVYKGVEKIKLITGRKSTTDTLFYLSTNLISRLRQSMFLLLRQRLTESGWHDFWVNSEEWKLKEMTSSPTT